MAVACTFLSMHASHESEPEHSAETLRGHRKMLATYGQKFADQSNDNDRLLEIQPIIWLFLLSLVRRLVRHFYALPRLVLALRIIEQFPTLWLASQKADASHRMWSDQGL